MSKPASFEITKFYVLLALADGPLHGYAISDRVIGDSSGGVFLRPSTLYATLRALEDRNLIECVGQSDVSSRRITYQLTEMGGRLLKLEAQMHEQAARLAKTRLGLHS